MLKRRLWQRILPPQARGSHRRRNLSYGRSHHAQICPPAQHRSDRNRTQRQRNVLNVIIGKAKSMGISEGLELLNEILPLVKTDMSKSTIVSQATNAMRYLKWNITQDTIPHTYPKLVNVDGTEVLLLDWDQTISYIHKILYPGLELRKSLLDDKPRNFLNRNRLTALS